MKRTFTANINGRIYSIDEDAYQLLNSYLEQLRQMFRSNEGSDEIVNDIESRIDELLYDATAHGVRVITIADVSRIIETMGTPEALGRDTGTDGDAPASSDSDSPFISFNIPGRKRLYRNMQNKVFGGVIGGLATYLGWNANIMRLFFIALVMCTKFLPFTVVYLLAWMIIPAAVTPSQRLAMNGEPVNIDTIGQQVIATETMPESDGGFWRSIFSGIGKVLMAILGFSSGAAAFGCLVAFMILCAGGIIYSATGSYALLANVHMPELPSLWVALSSVLAFLSVGVLVFGLVGWCALSVVLNSPSVKRTTVATILITSMILLLAAIVLAAIGFSA